MWRYLKQVLIAFDQLINALLGGWADESLSAHAAAQLAATDTKAQKGVDDAAAAKAQADKGVRDAATAKTAAEKANGDLTTFKTNIGDTTVDFAAVYTAARDAN